MALSSHDPIMSTFELRQEMKKLAQVEKEFKVWFITVFRQQPDLVHLCFSVLLTVISLIVFSLCYYL